MVWPSSPTSLTVMPPRTLGKSLMTVPWTAASTRVRRGAGMSMASWTRPWERAALNVSRSSAGRTPCTGMINPGGAPNAVAAHIDTAMAASARGRRPSARLRITGLESADRGIDIGMTRAGGSGAGSDAGRRRPRLNQDPQRLRAAGLRFDDVPAGRQPGRRPIEQPARVGEREVDAAVRRPRPEPIVPVGGMQRFVFVEIEHVRNAIHVVGIARLPVHVAVD